MYLLGLKQMVNLLYGYPDANIYGCFTDSDIIKLLLLATYNLTTLTSVAKYKHMFIILT